MTLGRGVLPLLLAVGALAPAAGAMPLNPAPADTPLYVNPFEILVTAPRVRVPLKRNPAATTVVGDQALRSMPRTVAVDEALKSVPGVRIDNQANGERIHLSIRGQGILSERGIRGIKVLLDGFPLNDPTGVAPDLYDVDWATVGRIEVQRGPAAALYGGGGSGGVVNIETLDGGKTPVSAIGSAVFGSHGFRKAFGSVGSKGEATDARVSASRMMGDGYRDHTAFDAANVYEKVRWTASRRLHFTQILSWTDYFDQNAEGLNIAQVDDDPIQANPDAAKFDEFYGTRRFSTGMSGRYEITPNQDIQLSGSFRTTWYRESVPSSVRHRTYLTPGATAQYDIHLGAGQVRNNVSVGSDVQWQTIDEYRVANLERAREGNLLSNQRISQRGAGVFVMDRIEIGPRWGVTLGGRYDAIDNELTDLFAGDSLDLSGNTDFDKSTGRVGLFYTPKRQVNLYANWGQGFLPPTTEELANNPAHQGGFNENLKSATSQGEEIGARGEAVAGLFYDVALFHLKTENDFDRYRMTERPLETFYRNAGSSKRLGMESLVRWTPIRRVSIEAAYTYGDFTYTEPTEIDGNSLPNCPQHQSYVDVEGEVIPGLTVAVTNEYQSKWAIDSKNSAWTDGFTLWGARAAYHWRFARLAGDLTFAATNLLDKEYMAFTEPDPDGNSYQPGPGRQFFGGVKVEF